MAGWFKFHCLLSVELKVTLWFTICQGLWETASLSGSAGESFIKIIPEELQVCQLKYVWRRTLGSQKANKAQRKQSGLDTLVESLLSPQMLTFPVLSCSFFPVSKSFTLFISLHSLFPLLFPPSLFCECQIGPCSSSRISVTGPIVI